MDSNEINVNELKFGPLFSDMSKVTPLTNAEAAGILGDLIGGAPPMTDDSTTSQQVMQSAKAHAEFASFGLVRVVAEGLLDKIKDMQANAGSIRRQLHPYEITSLINLAPEDYEQAVSLIPSLLDFDGMDEKQLINDVVDEIARAHQGGDILQVNANKAVDDIMRAVSKARLTSFFKAYHHTDDDDDDDYEPITGDFTQVGEEVKDLVVKLVRNAERFWIGIASEKDLKSVWYNTYRELGATDIAVVYETESEEHCMLMKNKLINSFADRCEGERGFTKLKEGQTHFVFVVWTRAWIDNEPDEDDVNEEKATLPEEEGVQMLIKYKDAVRHGDKVDPVTGGWRKSTDAVILKIRQDIIAGCNAKSFKIGITSNGTLRSTWNNTYKKQGVMKHIAVVYTTSSEKFRLRLADALVKEFKESELCENNRAPGAGRLGGKKPNYYVYIVWN